MFYSPLEHFELGILKGFFITLNDDSILDFSFTNLSFFFFILLTLFIILIELIFFKNDEKIFSNPLQKIFEKMILFIINLLKDNLN
jgi:hypothetical protein